MSTVNEPQRPSGGPAAGPDHPGDVEGRRCWRPTGAMDTSVAAAGRIWARKVLADLLPPAPDPAISAVVDLLLTELVSNAIKYGGGVSEAAISTEPAGVRVTVCDDNPAPPVIPAVGDLDREHGRGMHLIVALADGWGVQPGLGARGKCVWADVATAPLTDDLISRRPAG